MSYILSILKNIIIFQTHKISYKQNPTKQNYGTRYVNLIQSSSDLSYQVCYRLKRVPSRFFGIRNLSYLKAGIRDFEGKGAQDSGSPETKMDRENQAVILVDVGKSRTVI
jgi:hypothetical protein